MNPAGAAGSRPAIVRVESLGAPGLEPYRTLRRQTDHFREGIFVAEGEKVVRRLLASGIRVRSMLLTPEWLEAIFPEADRKGAVPGTFAGEARLYVAAKSLLETIVGFGLHQGLMAVAETPGGLAEADIGSSRGGAAGLYVALDDLVNAENVGLVVRNCAAFGVDALVVGETSSSPYLRRAVRASMGTVFGLRIHASTNLVSTLGRFADAGIAVVAADPSAPASIYETGLQGDVCVVLGHEGSGIRPAVLDACRSRASIPMWRGTDSINVASACAVFLSEARRQRLTR